ncbi:MAG: Rne/Rng family ribonuclease [Burkholderiaceae bacterium]|nr:Rne/Rng family ribonuclease [Burkholderiaceae bacterium]
MKRMLFNATQQEELRVAIVDGQKLIDIDIETAGREQRKSNIYKGVITRIEPSLEACFVNYGEERHGFLPFKEVARSYFREGVDVRNASIREALREGQEIMVQVEKEERGNKGAALTSFISLAGRYLVLMPNNPRGGGVSRRVEGEDRQELRETMDKLDLPQGMSVIARTAGIGRNVDELQWDLNYLMQLWTAIDGASRSAPGAFLIYQESSLVIRAIRDYFQPDIGEILIDTDDIHEQAQQFMSHVMPDMVHRVKRYRDDVPLFSRFQIEHQIETAYSRTVPLPSGGAIVIDHTEALVSIDVNSARATRGSDIETTAFNTNLEAADEVARQLRLRDLGGLIVIDFIDMENARNQREIETRLKDALHYDRARVQMGKISRFGLMELSRQRLRPSLSEGSHVTCPRCNGTGHIRDTESSALQVLRIVQEEAMKENSAAIHVQAPVDVAAFLLNEKRGEILKIETRHRVSVILIPNKHLETPHYKLERIKHDDPRLDDLQASYKMAEEVDTDIGYSKRKAEEARPRQEAVVKSVTPDQPAPIVERKPVEAAPAQADEVAAEGFLSRLFGLFRKKPATPAEPEVAAKAAPRERNNGERGGRNRRSRGGRGRDKEERVAGAEVKPVKEAPKEAAPKEAKEPRQPRQPREPREPRENREIREPREPRAGGEPREAREGGEPRRERTPRQPREERKPVEEVVLPQAELPLNAEAASTEPVEPIEPQLEGEVAEGGDEQPRRRRRRGGRNRNRRDRDAATGEGGADAEAGDEGADVEAPAQAEAEETQASLETAPADENADTAETADVAVDAVPEAAASETAADKAPEPAAAVDVVLAAAAEAAAEPVPAPEPAAPAARVAQVKPAQVEAAPRAVTAQPATTTAATADTATDIDAMLRAAGLQMAVTNPERLRAVQIEQTAVVPAPRAPRERKPQPPASNEPLQQVETRH